MNGMTALSHDVCSVHTQPLSHPHKSPRQYFVLLGAGSAMGPLLTLLSLGANVIAIDLDRKGIWDRLIRETRNSPGTLIFPLKKKQSRTWSLGVSDACVCLWMNSRCCRPTHPPTTYQHNA